jgi:murein DD-endopeptidase MepM/ murein hydrolase activator NlpD
MSRADPDDQDAVSPDPRPADPPQGPVWILSIRRIPTSPAVPRARRWALSHRQLRRGLPLVAAGILVLLGSWVYLGVRTYQAAALEQRVGVLEAELEQVGELAVLLEEVEEGYARLRGLFAPERGEVDALWLPPPGGTTPGSSSAFMGTLAGRLPEAADLPSLWPLTERGFLTQGLIEALGPGDDVSTHPGIDVAVPSGSYIRAVGGGTVEERGEDPLYGLFVVVAHADGYRSLYAHASVITAEPGRNVVAGEVLGLTGSSGRSTAPHLHLELTRDGEQVDPLTLLRRP